MLKERGAKDVLPELGVWVSRLDPNAANYEHLRLEALWAYQSLDVPEPKLLASVLESKEPGARATASRIAGEWASRLSNPVAVLAPRVLDENPRVRLEAVRALVQLNTPTAAVVASQALDKPLDKWLDYAIWLTLRELAPVWLPELQAGKIDFGGDPKKIVFALQAAGSGDVVKPLLGLWTSGKIGRDRAAAVLPMVAQLGGPVELQTAWTEAGKLAAEQPGTATAILAGLEQSARQRNAKPTNSRNSVANLIASTNADVRLAAVKLAGAWKEDAARVELVKLVEATDTAVSLRQAAADSLASIGTLDAVKALAALGAADRPVAVRLAAVSALASADTGTAAKLAVELLGDSPISADPSTLFTAFAQRKTGAAELARALKGKKLPGDVAKIGVRVAKAAGQPDQTLIDALTTAGSLTTPKRDFTKAEIDALTANVLKLGDAARGEKIYRRADANCMKCHAIAGAGGVVGPDFTSIGASAQPDYLVESLLLPNAKIKEGYNSYIVATVDGKVVTGTKVREANGQLVLRDAEDREIVIPLADIESRKDGKSLMPDGTTDSLTGQEFLDLAKFLSVLGKVDSGYAAAAGRVVRRWETVQLTKELFTLTNRDRIAAVARPGAAISWVPAYSLVSGDLPLTELPQFQPHKTQPPYSVARFQLDVTTAGKVKLLLNDPVGLSLWVDGVPLDAAKEMTPTLKAGVRTVTVAVNSELRQSPLRVELDEVSGSPARARIIGGK